MNKKDIAKLKKIAGLVLDQRLTDLRAAARAKEKVEGALAELAAPDAPTADLAGASGALAALAYERWADARRAEINLTLARKTQQWLDARDAAKLAFGKTEALEALSKRLAR